MERLTRRENAGKGHRYYLDGKRVPGVTSVLDDGFPKPALINWAANATAEYAFNHWDDLTAMDPAARLRAMERGRFEGVKRAGERGTLVHSLAFAMAHRPGVAVQVPEDLTGHVDAWLQFAEDWGVVEELVEIVVVNRRFRYMGTLDSIATLLVDGRRWLLDYKTSGKGVYPENALQLAGYRNAETYIGADGNEVPLTDVDCCGVVWLRADGYDLVPVEVGEREWRTFLHCLGVARWRELDREEIVGDALAPPDRKETVG